MKRFSLLPLTADLYASRNSTVKAASFDLSGNKYFCY